MSRWLKKIPFAYLLLAGLLIGGFVEVKAIWLGGLDWALLLSGWNLAGILGYIALTGAWAYCYARGIELNFKTGKARRWGLAAAAVLAALFPALFFYYSDWSFVFVGAFLRVWLYAACAWWVGGLVGSLSQKEKGVWYRWIAGLVLVGTGLILVRELSHVVDYPFSLYWSEGNRFWDYSMMWGRRLYDIQHQGSFDVWTDDSRQALWGLPHIFDGVSIWMARLWNAVLFTIPYAVLGWVALKYPKENRFTWVLSGLFIFLFLSQGPIYTPLVLGAVLVAAAFRTPYLVGLALLVAAGYYMKRARFTWVFAPAIWIFMLAIVKEKGLDLKRWLKAGGYALAGLSLGFIYPYYKRMVGQFNAAQAVEVLTNPESVEEMAQVTNLVPPDVFQTMLWDRLFPNATYAPGILIGLLLAAGPLAGVLFVLWRKKHWQLNIWQALIVLGGLGGFLGVGLIASVKIGGGSNLHNLDMFLIGLAFMFAAAYNAVGGERIVAVIGGAKSLRVLALLAVTIPATPALFNAVPLELPAAHTVEHAFETIVEEVGAVEGEVLFMDERHFLTFGYVQDIVTVVDYEKKLMIDKAFSGDEELYAEFYADLEAQRFALIVSDPLKIQFFGENRNFGAENDVWVEWVARPVLCYYEPLHTFDDVGVELLVPREAPLENCP